MSTNEFTSTRDLITQIEQGIENARNGDDFRAFLRAAAKFHRYSIGNVMLIALQCPSATRVAGFHTWLKLGRHINRGERGIRILAPIVLKGAQTDNDDGPDGGGSSGGAVAVRFKTVSVFDITQTDGADLPSPVTLLHGADYGLFDTLAQVAATEGLSLDRESGVSNANGFYMRSSGRIWIEPTLEPLMSAKTLAHELSHHFAQHDVEGHCREEAETIAEASAFIVLNHFGFDTGCYSFGYLASWADVKTFRAKVAEIQRVAATIINRIEAQTEQQLEESERRAA